MLRIFAWMVPVGLLLMGSLGCEDMNDGTDLDPAPPADTTTDGMNDTTPETGVGPGPAGGTGPGPDIEPGTDPADDIEPLEERGDDAP